MPTLTEIKNPELTYCEAKDAHCLCMKCIGRNQCYHDCCWCELATELKEEDRENTWANAASKPVTKCDVRDQIGNHNAYVD